METTTLNNRQMSTENERQQNVFAKSFCSHCGNGIEFETDYNGLEVICPHHCQNPTLLNYTKPIPPPPVLVDKTIKPKSTKPPKSFSEVISIICIVAFLLWTFLCGIGVLDGLYEVTKSEQVDPAITSNNQYAKAGGTIGFAVGMGIWFGIWLAGAIPTFMIFIFAKLSTKNKQQTN
jgi:hypothetical protein